MVPSNCTQTLNRNDRNSQYESKFKDWGFIKNLDEAEWRHIASRIKMRQPKSTNVVLGGVLLPSAKVQKAIKRYSYQGTIDRLNQGAPTLPLFLTHMLYHRLLLFPSDQNLLMTIMKIEYLLRYNLAVIDRTPAIATSIRAVLITPPPISEPVVLPSASPWHSFKEQHRHGQSYICPY